MTNINLTDSNENTSKGGNPRMDNRVRGIGNLSLRSLTNIPCSGMDNTKDPLTATFEIENVSLRLSKQVDDLIKESGYSEITHPMLFVRFSEADECTRVFVIGFLEKVGFFNKEVEADEEQKVLLKKLLIEQIVKAGTDLSKNSLCSKSSYTD